VKSAQLIQELACGLDVIKTLVSGVTQAEAQSRPDDDSWSILEVICHLYDEEREDFRQRLDIILHHPDSVWPPIDPRGWVLARKYNHRDLIEMLNRFSAERTKSVEWLRSLSSPNWEAEITSPFGSMKAGDMLAAWVAHDTLHSRQLVELRHVRVIKLTAPYDVQYAGDW
jgi:hypothetical protein